MPLSTPGTSDSPPSVRVLHIITGLAVGGAEMQLLSLLRHTRHHADVVVLYNAGSVAEAMRREGFSVTCLEMTSNRDLRAIATLVKMLRHGNYDVVHTHLYRAAVYGRTAAALARVPVIVSTEHSLLPDGVEGRSTTQGIRLLYRAAERLGHVTVAVSQAVESELLAWGVRPNRIVHIPNGLQLEALSFDADARLVSRDRWGISPHARVIGGLGRLHPVKRFDLLVRAAAPLLGPDTQLVLVGEGPERAPLERLAAELGVADHVRFTGTEPAAEALSGMDVLVSCSPAETFGLVVLEGLANGLPVVYASCPALDQVQDVTLSAEKVPMDAVSVGCAIRRAIDGPARPERPLPPALEEFTLQETSNRLDDLYVELRAR